jgi:hypothetical protein
MHLTGETTDGRRSYVPDWRECYSHRSPSHSLVLSGPFFLCCKPTRLLWRSVAHATTFEVWPMGFYATARRAVPQNCPSLPPSASFCRVMMCNASGSSVDRPGDVSLVTYRHTYFYTGPIRTEGNGILRWIVWSRFHWDAIGRRATRHMLQPAIWCNRKLWTHWVVPAKSMGVICFKTDTSAMIMTTGTIWLRGLIPAKRPLTTP